MLITIKITARSKSSFNNKPSIIRSLDKKPPNGGIPAKEKNTHKSIKDQT
jgi:hypothetical protein